MNIVYIVDSNPAYIKMLHESIESINQFNNNVNYHIIVNSEKYIPEIKYGKQYPFKLTTKYRERLNSRDGAKDRLNNSSYLKLFIPEILKDLDKCLFVDCDCVCFNNLDEVYKKTPQYVALSSINITQVSRKIELGIPENGNYYSTGIMLMNLKNLREDNFKEICFEHMNDISCSFWCHEETLINKNYYNKIEAFEKTVQYFNREVAQYYQYNNCEIFKKNLHGIKFAHIGGPDKTLFYKLIGFSKEYSKFLQIQKLKDIVPAEDFLDKKIRNIIIDQNHSQMRNWFKHDYNIVTNPAHAEVAVFHGTNYTAPANLQYVNLILKYNLPIITIEDTFLRSIYPSRNRKCNTKLIQSIGYCVNNYAYFESDMDTTIHRMLKKYSDSKNVDNINRGQEIINYIVLNGLSKYNCQMSKIPKSVLGVLNHSILVIDQAYGDQSIVSSNADDSTFYEMLIAAVKENPRKNIFVKVHPESQTGGRGGFYTDSVINKAIKETGRKIFKLTEPVNPINLLKLVDKVYTCSSGFGFEALMCRKPVICFGIPFYARLGLTDDRNPKAQEKIMITRIEELVRIVFDKFSVFRDTYTNKVISVDRALNYIIDLRNRFLKGMIQ